MLCDPHQREITDEERDRATISSLMLEYGAKLDSWVALVAANGSAEEALRYKRAVGKMISECSSRS
jgi:hypothetical protein